MVNHTLSQDQGMIPRFSSQRIQAIVGWKQKKGTCCPLSRPCQRHSASWASVLLSHLSSDDGDSENLSVYLKDWLPTWY